MSNFIYKKAKQALLNGQISAGNSIKVAFLDTSIYTANENSDEFISDIPSSAIKHRSNALENVTSLLGTLDANDLLVDGYSGQPFQAIALYQSGSSDNNSRLICYIDDSEGLPFSRNS
jgi:hypothetical protein